MSRLALLTCVAIILLPRVVHGQFEVSASWGVHVDRAPESDRAFTTGGAEMYAGKGEASVLGARVGYWLRPGLGLQLDLSRSSNESWFGHTPLLPPSFLPPSFVNRTSYLSVRGVARTGPTRSLQLYAAAGPAVMLHSGTGTNLRSRSADLGGVLEAGARLRLVGRVGMQLAISNYLYGSRYDAAPSFASNGGDPDVRPGGAFRHDLLLTTGLVLFPR